MKLTTKQQLDTHDKLIAELTNKFHLICKSTETQTGLNDLPMEIEVEIDDIFKNEIKYLRWAIVLQTISLPIVLCLLWVLK